MKRWIVPVVLLAVMVAGCSNKEKEEELQKKITQLQREQATLQQSITERDTYVGEVIKAINEVRSDLGREAANELIDEFDLELQYNIAPSESDFSNS